MNRLLPILLFARIALGHTELVEVAQGRGLFVVVADGGGERGGFEPDRQPRDVANTIGRVSVVLPQKDVRLPDGQIITDYVVCATMPPGFEAVGQVFEDFHQVTDDEVRELLTTPTV